MLYAPATAVHLLNVPLSLAQKHQLDFSDSGSQFAYFNSRHILNYSIFTDFSFQRKDNVIRVPVNVEYIGGCNYCMYQNANFTGKWFYCFVTEKKYINDNCTELTIKTDVFQTYLFNYNFGGCFVERMHTRLDEIGEYREPEPISINAYPVEQIKLIETSYYDQTIYLYFSKRPTATITGVTTAEQDSGAISFKYVKMYPYSGSGGSGFGSELDADLSLLEQAGEMGLISGVGAGVAPAIMSDIDVDIINAPFNPKNNKTLLYCYSVLTGDSTFKLDIPTVGGRICNFSRFSRGGSAPFIGVTVNSVPGVVMSYSNFPIAQVPINSDINQISKSIRSAVATMPFSILSGVIGSAGSLISGGVPSISPFLKPVQDIVNSAAKYEISDMQPKQLSGFSPGNARFTAEQACISVIKYAPNSTDLQAVDDFFTAYGYAVSKAIEPTFRTRANHNYLKTSDCLIMPNSNADFIPAEDKEELENIFNSGVTVWHNPGTMGNYSVDNSPVS